MKMGRDAEIYIYGATNVMQVDAPFSFGNYILHVAELLP